MKNSKTQLSKMVQSGGFIEITDKMYGSGMRTALELPGIINSIDKGKSVSKALLGAGYNLVDNKTDINRQMRLFEKNVWILHDSSDNSK